MATVIYGVKLFSALLLVSGLLLPNQGEFKENNVSS